VISCSRVDHRAPSNCKGRRATCNFCACVRVPKVDRLLLKMPVRLGPMGNESPKAQISGGKAASFANALRTTRSTCVVATDRPEAEVRGSILLRKPPQIILDNFAVLN
jgi:hypothetical protein